MSKAQFLEKLAQASACARRHEYISTREVRSAMQEHDLPLPHQANLPDDLVLANDSIFSAVFAGATRVDFPAYLQLFYAEKAWEHYCS